VPYTLLLADDSVTIQRVIELTFADEDVTVIAVSDGDQAIERLESAPPDIVLADIGMPGKNGYEVAQYIRRSSKLAHIPVVLLTGAFEPVDQARADEAGCDGVLAKPFEPQLVIGRVKELLARSARPAAVPAAADSARVPDAMAPPPAASAAADARFGWASPPVQQQPEPPPADSNSNPVQQSELNDYFDRLDAAFSTLSSNVPAPPPIVAVPDRSAGSPGPDLDWFSSKAEETGGAKAWDLPAPPADVPPMDLPLAPLPDAPAPSPEPETFAAVTAIEPTPEAPEADAAGPMVGAAPVAAAVVEDAVADAPSVAEAAPTVETGSMIETAAMVETPSTVEPASIAPPDERLAPIEESAPIEAAPAVEETVASQPAAAPPALELPLPNLPPLPALPDAFAALLAAEQDASLSGDAGLWPAAPTTVVSPPAAVSEELIEAVTRRVLDRLSDTVVRDAVAGIASTIAERLVREEIERIKAAIK
jgi:CheY-like chemotaxis protein